MTNQEQADRLTAAGWDQTKGYWSVKGAKAPDEGEMMEFLAAGRKIEVRKYFTNWVVEIDSSGECIKHPDLTEALVQACEKVLVEKKEEGR